MSQQPAGPQLQPGTARLSGPPRWSWLLLPLLLLFLVGVSLAGQAFRHSLDCIEGCVQTPPPPRLDQSYPSTVVLSGDHPVAIRDVTMTLARPLGYEAIDAALLLRVEGAAVRVAAGNADDAILPVFVAPDVYEQDTYNVGSVRGGVTRLHVRLIVELADAPATPVTMSLTLTTRITAAYGETPPAIRIDLGGGAWDTTAPPRVSQGVREGELELAPGHDIEGRITVRVDPGSTLDPSALVVDRVLAFQGDRALPSPTEVSIDPANGDERGFAVIENQPTTADFRDVLACPTASPCVLEYTVRIDARGTTAIVRAHWRFEADLRDYSSALPPASRGIEVRAEWKALPQDTPASSSI